MKIRILAATALLASAPLAAQAERLSALNHVDIYYVPSADLDLTVPGVGSASDDGDGFGIRGRGQVADQVFLSGEYQTVEYDDTDLELDQLRLGVGFAHGLNPNLSFLGSAEFVRMKINLPGFGSESETGFGLHAGLLAQLSPQFSLNGQIGYLNVGDAGDGFEFLVGARFQFNDQFAAFIDYRSTSLDDDGFKTEFDDLRIGVGFHF